MLNFDVKAKIKKVRDILVGKVPDPKAQVEQITIALIYKFMDDMDLESMELGAKREFFKDEYEKYAWSNIMQSDNSGQQRFDIYYEGIYKMSTNPHLPQLFRDIFKDATVPYRDVETLNMFLKEINDFNYDHSEELGNAFEYLLSIMGSQGDAGQFRTPRHIIDMIVAIVDPKKTDTVLDPACGTAGFLISSYKHILENNKDDEGNSILSADDRNRMTENFAGYDISPDMVRLSRVNMYLHKFVKPKIYEYDTLTSIERWDENYDVILANPPFMTPKGGIIPHNRFRVKAKRSEVLFVDYIAEHLSPSGRAGIIVPEGIVFQSANAYKELRKYLVEDGLLYAVISLPGGVFNPYSGVKTSILLFDKSFAKQREEILFVKLNNDGFDLGAQRKDVTGSDIPEAINIIKDYLKGIDVSNNELVTIASKKDVAEQDYILVGERYKEIVVHDSNYPLVTLGEVCDIYNGSTPSRTEISYWENGDIPWFTIDDIRKQGRVINYTEQKITNKALRETSVKLLQPNTVLLCCTASVGEYAITTIPMTTNQQFNGLVIKKEYIDKLKPKYLFYMISNLSNELKRLGGKTSFNFVSVKNLKQIKIPLPPLNVQEEIVIEIESYQKIVNGASQVVENYKPSIIIDPSWAMEKLSNLCTYDRQMISSNDNSLPYIGMEDIESNNGIISKSVCEKMNNIGNAGAYLFNSNHILYGRLRPYLNKVAIPEFIGKCSTELIPLKVNEIIRKDFLSVILRSDSTVKFAMSTNTGARMPRTDMNALKNLLVPLPNIEIQTQIMQEINEEIKIVAQNKRLIELMDKKIKDTISLVWGEY